MRIALNGKREAESERYVDFVYQPLRESDGTISGINVLGVDITDRKLATEALLQTELRASSVLESMTDGFHLIDATGKFRQFNSAGRAIYARHSVDADALIGVPVLTAFPRLLETPIGKTVFATLYERKPEGGLSRLGTPGWLDTTTLFSGGTPLSSYVCHKKHGGV